MRKKCELLEMEKKIKEVEYQIKLKQLKNM